MELIQGGVQTELRGTLSLVLLVSTTGVTVYRRGEETALAYFSLPNTVSADANEKDLFVCTTSAVYSIPLASLSGDTSSLLTPLTYSPQGSILKICAEHGYIALITTEALQLISLRLYSLRTLELAGLACLDTYKRYVAFSTSSEVYTFCVYAETFSLENCYTPSTWPATPTFNRRAQTFCTLGVGENFYLGKNFSSLRFQFGEYQDLKSVKTSYDGVYGLGAVSLNNGHTCFFNGLGQGKEGPGDWRYVDSVPYLSTLDSFYNSWAGRMEGRTTEALNSMDPTPTQENFYLPQSIQAIAASEPDQAVWVKKPDGTKTYFTLPESAGAFRQICSHGSIDLPNYVYFWLTYKYHRAEDAEGEFFGNKGLLCKYDKALDQADCWEDTFRKETVNLLPIEKRTFSDSGDPNMYFSRCVKVGGAYAVLDITWPESEYSPSGKSRTLKVFTIEESTGVCTEVAREEELFYTPQFSLPELRGGPESVNILKEEQLVSFRVSNLEQQQFNITALTLGCYLAFSDTGQGIHYQGYTGHCKRLYPETAEVNSICLSEFDGIQAYLAYTTTGYSRVVEL